MPRLTHRESGVVVHVSDETAAALPLADYAPADEANKAAPKKASSSKKK